MRPDNHLPCVLQRPRLAAFNEEQSEALLFPPSKAFIVPLTLFVKRELERIRRSPPPSGDGPER